MQRAVLQLPGIATEDHPFVVAMLEGDEAKALETLPEAGAAPAYPLMKHAGTRAIGARGGAPERDRARDDGGRPAAGGRGSPGARRERRRPAQSVGSSGRARGNRARDLLPAERDASYIHGSVLWADAGTDAVLRPDRF